MASFKRGSTVSHSPSFSPAAEFIFHREQRETPSLKSYFDSRDQQGSLDTGWKPQAHSATSPLATVSAGVASGSLQRGEGGKDVVDGSNRAPSGGWQRREERETTDSGGGEPVPSKCIYCTLILPLCSILSRMSYHLYARVIQWNLCNVDCCPKNWGSWSRVHSFDVCIGCI